MDALSYKTKSASKATVTKEWIVVDADHNLGRLASKVAMILRGTNQVTHRTLTVGIT
jgi:large subunit ribosomal protein L13